MKGANLTSRVAALIAATALTFGASLGIAGCKHTSTHTSGTNTSSYQVVKVSHNPEKPANDCTRFEDVPPMFVYDGELYIHAEGSDLSRSESLDHAYDQAQGIVNFVAHEADLIDRSIGEQARVYMPERLDYCVEKSDYHAFETHVLLWAKPDYTIVKETEASTDDDFLPELTEHVEAYVVPTLAEMTEKQLDQQDSDRFPVNTQETTFAGFQIVFEEYIEEVPESRYDCCPEEKLLSESCQTNSE